ncbi:FAD-dependent oxidoreductase [bacterium]|nr:FAD-dependent oxidoreductase [bacterium]
MKKIAVIGGGPAGITTAIQLKRFGLQPLLFEKNRLGGLLWEANQIENYPGHQPIKGPELADLFRMRFQEYGIEIIPEEVVKLDYDREFIISTKKGEKSFSTVCMAAGTKPIMLTNIFNNDNVLYSIMPLLNARNKVIAIIGAGDIAFDYALNLARNNRVVILNRSSRIKALPGLAEQVLNNSNISYCQDFELMNIKFDVKMVVSGKKRAFEVDYLLVAIGREANKDCYTDALREREADLVAGFKLYLTGDVRGSYKQACIAAGSGLEAAMRIYHESDC